MTDELSDLKGPEDVVDAPTVEVKIRTRLLLWLLAAAFPIFTAGFLVTGQVNDRVSTRVERDLQNLLELEAARIDRALAEQEIDTAAIAAQPPVIEAMERTATGPTSFDSLADSLIFGRMNSAQRNTEDVQIVGRNGDVLGQTAGFSWQPYDPDLIEQAMEDRRILFGNAFRSGVGDERLGVVAPVVTEDGSVLGALVLENRLDPIIDLIGQHEGFGTTSEAVLVQPVFGDVAEMITLRRFERDAAFRSTVTLGDRTPSARSLEAVEAEVVRLSDYRGQDTVASVQRIEVTGWGLAIKIDADEAYALSQALSRYVQVAGVITIIVLVLGWLIQVRPIGRRIQRAADASSRLAGGDYHSLIGDNTNDEIGDLARRIDGLASELEADIAARERVEQLLRFQANHDTLTRLINRQQASTLIGDLRPEDSFSLLFLDVDGFKFINDTYGHAVGDQVLVAVAERLSTVVDRAAIWARWGGDEFLAILPGADETAAREMMERVSGVFADPVASAVGRHTIGASIGAATSGQGRSPNEVLAEADSAMFKSKRQNASYQKVSPAAIRLVDAALSDRRVEAAFQPVVRLDEANQVHLHGAEALVRIRNEDGSMLLPAEFLPALGANELAAALDTRVAEIALNTLADWHRRGAVPQHFRIALNAGSASMSDPQFVSRLAGLIEASGVRPNLVMIEIPETVEIISREAIESLRSLGVVLAIDDVGCQYSNLERMVDIEADVAKLDRRWIPDLATVESSTSEVLRGLVAQCRALGLSVIAEGVETEEQLVMLAELGVDVFQGYLFGRPVSALDFERNWHHAVSSADGAKRTSHQLR